VVIPNEQPGLLLMESLQIGVSPVRSVSQAIVRESDDLLVRLGHPIESSTITIRAQTAISTVLINVVTDVYCQIHIVHLCGLAEGIEIAPRQIRAGEDCDFELVDRVVVYFGHGLEGANICDKGLVVTGIHPVIVLCQSLETGRLDLPSIVDV
jgi:hypothetical protein